MGELFELVLPKVLLQAVVYVMGLRSLLVVRALWFVCIVEIYLMAGFDSKLAVLLSVARFVVQVFLVNRRLGGFLQVLRRAL